MARWASQGDLYLIGLTLFFAGCVTFFALEEYLGGMMAHLPILFIYLLSFSGAEWVNQWKSMMGVSIGVGVSTLLGTFLWPSDPNGKMKRSVEGYLKTSLDEIRLYMRDGYRREGRCETGKTYRDFLREFYKSSSGSWLSSNYGRLLFEFALSLHNFMENVRVVSRENGISIEKHGEIERFLQGLERGKGEKFRFSGPTGELAETLLEKRRNLFETKEHKGGEGYRHNRDFFLWIRGNLSFDSVRMRYALKMALILTIGLYISSKYGMEKSIWLPTTMLVMTQPYEKDSRNKVFNRIMGTLAGIGMATVIIPFLPGNLERGMAAVLILFPALLLMAVDYAWAVTFITLYAILISTILLPTSTVYFQRGYYTIMAGIIVIAIEWVFADRNKITVRKRVVQVVEADLFTLKGIMELYKGNRDNHIDDFIMKSYLYRDILSRNLKASKVEKDRRVMHISMVFIEKLLFLYSRVREGKLPEGYLKEMKLVEKILEGYLQVLSGKKVEFPREELTAALEANPKERSIKELLRLTKHFIEEVIDLYT